MSDKRDQLLRGFFEFATGAKLDQRPDQEIALARDAYFAGVMAACETVRAELTRSRDLDRAILDRQLARFFGPRGGIVGSE